MTPSNVTVTAPSRLHFGMFSFGRTGERQFGGLGVMLDKPALRLRISPAAELSTTGLLAERARAFALRAAEQLGISNPPPCRIEVLEAPPEHSGFGVGTQLGLSVAAGLNALFGREPLEPAELARVAGRGERSAIGSYGFARGGMLMEAGKLPHESLSPLEARGELPPFWRFVLVIPPGEQGVHGVDERRAFLELLPVPAETTAELRHTALTELLPAAMEADFPRFSKALYHYGHQAGLCFSQFQHGAYASERLQKLVERIRGLGIQGVGQSSWGPTIFSLVPDSLAAARLVQSLEAAPECQGAEMMIAAVSHRGARIERE